MVTNTALNIKKTRKTRKYTPKSYLKNINRGTKLYLGIIPLSQKGKRNILLKFKAFGMILDKEK